MNKELREKAVKVGIRNGYAIDDETYNELITLIRTATLDEVKESVKDIKTLLPEYGFDVFVNIEDAIEAIDNLRANDGD